MKRLPAGRSPAGAAAPGPFTNIQILRFVAALCVVIHHVSAYLEMLRGIPRLFPAFDGILGAFGVAIFFAISGFLMAGLLGRTAPATFLAHRVARIVPAYLAVTLLFAGLFAVLKLGFSLNVLALTLAPTGPRSYPLGVEWTLVFELSFYVALFLLALAGGAAHLVAVAAGWLVVLFAAWCALPPASVAGAQPPVLLVFVSSACAPFAGGLLLPRLLARHRLPRTALLLVPPLVLASVAVSVPTARWLCGLAALLLVGVAVQRRQAGGANPPMRTVLRFGDWSYVLYLAHVPVIFVVLRFAPQGWSGGTLWAACLAAVLAATALLGPWDLRGYRLMRRAIDRAPRRRVAGLVAAYLAMFLGSAGIGSVQTMTEERRLARAGELVAGLPPGTWLSPDVASAALDRVAAPVRAAVEGLDSVTYTEARLRGWAFDPERPDRHFVLAAFCGGHLAGMDLARRLRPDIARMEGFEAVGTRRIGFRVRIPAHACPPGAPPLAVLIDPDDGTILLPAS
ncbi:MAG: acyltransferase [Methylobacterium frigidaeris]